VTGLFSFVEYGSLCIVISALTPRAESTLVDVLVAIPAQAGEGMLAHFLPGIL